MPKYEELVKEKNKGSIRIDELAKKYKMSVIDVKNVRQMVHDAELETSLVKAVGMNSPEMKAAKEEINDLKNKIANLDDALRSKDYWRDPDYKFLVEENLKLRQRITELDQEVLEVRADNTKMARQVNDQINKLREAGLL